MIFSYLDNIEKSEDTNDGDVEKQENEWAKTNGPNNN